ncbi:hypothetical protein D4R99_05565 [bacterium]|nr:MAG: hypothetical protein D4R99_05565 [bacterium]
MSFDDDKMFCKKCGKPLTSEYQIEPKEVAKKTVFEDRIKADPLNIELLHEYAQFLFNSMIFKDTITVSLKILAINENDGLANELLFKSYFQLNMLKEATEFGKQLLLEKPTDIFLLQKLAEISGKLGNAHKETEYYTQILRQQPANTNALLNKAYNLLEENQLAKAIEIFRELYQEGQNDRITTIYIGIDKALNADYKAAIKLLSPILSNDNLNQDDVNINRGVLYFVYCLCQSSAELTEIEKWAARLDIRILKQNHHPLDEQKFLEIADFVISQNLLKIKSLTYAKDQILVLTQSYLGDEYFTANSNPKIAEIWYTIGNKQVEMKMFADAINSFQKASDLMPSEKIYKEKHAEYTNLFEIFTRKRKRKTSFIIAASIIGLIIIVASIFVYKNFEEKSAFELAKNENSSSSYQTYLDKYPKGKYFAEAQQLKEEASWTYAKNLNTVESYDDFISHYGNSKHFQEANTKKEDALWNLSKNLKNYSNYIQQYPAGKYIKDIKYDIPDIEKIKRDLLGQKISTDNIHTWTFAYLEEFRNVTISNSNISSTYLEFNIDMDLSDYRTNEPYKAKVLVTYTLNDYGWIFRDVKASYFEKVGGW